MGKVISFGRLRSVGGYPLDEVTSALQKSVRRGLEDDALFWATELHLSGYDEYMWRRLLVMASEDIGPAEADIPAQVWALYQMAAHQKKSTRKQDGRPVRMSERLHIVNAVIRLCRARKSRVCDHAVVVFYEGERAGREVPDWALDRHTSRGRRMGRGWGHFFDEGARLENRSGEDRYEERARAIRRDDSGLDLFETTEEGE
jgi:replication-associated recombination protein RarA